MQQFLFLLLILFPVHLFAQTAPAQQLTQDHQPVPGMALQLIPPIGFSTATDFTGFVQAASRSTVHLSELGGSVHENLPKFSRESLMSRGIFVQREESFMTGLVPARFIEAEQFAHGSKQVKYIYLLGNLKQCFLITASFPKDVGDLGPLIKSSMLSAIPTAAE